MGELHLDDFPVTNNKTDFRVDTKEWDLLDKQVAEALTDLKRESRKLAHPGRLAPKDRQEIKEYIDDVKETLKSTDLQQDLDRRALDAELADEFSDGPLPFNLPTEEAATDDGVAAERPGSDAPGVGSGGGGGGGGGTTDGATVGQHRLNRVKTQLRNITIEHQVMRPGRDTPYKIWEVEGVGNHKKIVVTSNVDHPFYAVIDDGFMLWIKHNIAESVAEFFTETTGRTEAMLLIKSDILKHIGKMKIEIVEAPIEAAETA